MIRGCNNKVHEGKNHTVSQKAEKAVLWAATLHQHSSSDRGPPIRPTFLAASLAQASTPLALMTPGLNHLHGSRNWMFLHLQQALGIAASRKSHTARPQASPSAVSIHTNSHAEILQELHYNVTVLL